MTEQDIWALYERVLQRYNADQATEPLGVSIIRETLKAVDVEAPRKPLPLSDECLVARAVRRVERILEPQPPLPPSVKRDQGAKFLELYGHVFRCNGGDESLMRFWFNAPNTHFGGSRPAEVLHDSGGLDRLISYLANF